MFSGRAILSDDAFLVEHDALHRMVRITRTGRPLKTISEIRQTHDRVTDALASVRERTSRILLDTREVPPRSDPLTDRVLGRYVRAWFSGIERVAFLFRTALGRSQVSRIVGDFSLEYDVFQEESEAWRYLEEKLTSPFSAGSIRAAELRRFPSTPSMPAVAPPSSSPRPVDARFRRGEPSEYEMSALPRARR